MTNLTLSDEVKELAAGYVLDELEPEELDAFEQMMINDAAVRQEVRELQMLLGGLTVDVPQLTPPAHLRTKTLAALGITEEIPAVSASQPQVTPPKSINWSKVTAVAALIAAAALVWENFNLRQELTFAQQQTPESVATLLQRPNSKLVSLTSQTNRDASGTLLFTPGKWQEVVVSAQNLPPLPADQVYRLWLNLDNQQTIYCGEFQTNSDGSISRSIQPPQLPPPGTKATGLFVTVEQKAAAISPTGKLVISGTI
ncbi:MAG: anti-sigma factor [Thermosynechococcaceae cyanobacterium MS004]|nr:anti-sigma factor [Thermosynechococcaceae cyanobacterium MS004]